MKIICVGRNYVAHIEELKNEVPADPVVFMKPDTALLRPGSDFYLPSHLGEVHHEVELVLKVSKEGKHVSEQFAHKYYSEIGLGIDFTARDLQAKLKSKGLPWELAKAFDNSAPIGEFVAKEELEEFESIEFSLTKNGQTVQQGSSSHMIYNFHKIISFVSKYITLRKGDLIYTGTPAGVGPVAIGDKLEGFINGKKHLALDIK